MFFNLMYYNIIISFIKIPYINSTDKYLYIILLQQSICLYVSLES